MQSVSLYGSTYTLLASSTGKLARTIAWAALMNDATRVFLDHSTVRAYLETQPWGVDFLKFYNALSTGIDIDNIAQGSLLAVNNNASSVRKVVVENKLAQKEIEKFDKIVRKAKNENVPYLGKITDPQLAKNIDETVQGIINDPVKSRTQIKKHNGSVFENKNNDLPTIINGKVVEYREYRVQPVEDGQNVHRIVVGSDGSYYYSNTHYGQNYGDSGVGVPFYKLGTLPQNTIDEIFGGVKK